MQLLVECWKMLLPGGMKLSEIFNCDKPVPFLEWCKDSHDQGSIGDIWSDCDWSKLVDVIDLVSEFYSCSATKNLVIRPEEPISPSDSERYIKNGESKFACRLRLSKEYAEWQTWQPVFLGEWEEFPNGVLFGDWKFINRRINNYTHVSARDIQSLESYFVGHTLDDLIRFYNKRKILVKFNPDYIIKH